MQEILTALAHLSPNQRAAARKKTTSVATAADQLFGSAYAPADGTDGGTLIIGDWQEANQFNPFYQGQVTEANVASAAWDSLVALTYDYKYAPQQASEIPTTANGGVVVPGETGVLVDDYGVQPGDRVLLIDAERDRLREQVEQPVHPDLAAVLLGEFLRQDPDHIDVDVGGIADVPGAYDLCLRLIAEYGAARDQIAAVSSAVEVVDAGQERIASSLVEALGHFGVQAWFKGAFGEEFHDFAGSVVVHAVGGWIALVAVLGVLGVGVDLGVGVGVGRSLVGLDDRLELESEPQAVFYRRRNEGFQVACALRSPARKTHGYSERWRVLGMHRT